MPVHDQFDAHHTGLNSPVSGGFNIVPDDGADLPQVTRGLLLTGAGDVMAVLKNGDTLVLPNLSAGVIYPIRIARVLATGTTATGLKGLV